MTHGAPRVVDGGGELLLHRGGGGVQLGRAEVGVAEDRPVELVSHAGGGVREHGARADLRLAGGHVEHKVGVGVAAAVRGGGAAAARRGRAHGHAAERPLRDGDAVVVGSDAAVARRLEPAHAVARPLLEARAPRKQRAGRAHDAQCAAHPAHRRGEQLVDEEALLRGRQVVHRGDRVVDPERLPQRRRIPAAPRTRGEAAPVRVTVRVRLWRACRVLDGEGSAVVVAVVVVVVVLVARQCRRHSAAQRHHNAPGAESILFLAGSTCCCSQRPSASAARRGLRTVPTACSCMQRMRLARSLAKPPSRCPLQRRLDRVRLALALALALALTLRLARCAGSTAAQSRASPRPCSARCSQRYSSTQATADVAWPAS